MSDPLEALPEKVNAIKPRLDALAVDARFDGVMAAFVEQRQYLEFAFDRFRDEMLAGFSRFERKLDQLIDTQARTNALVERRLLRLEGPSASD